jgi:hypothetical protein
VFFPVLLGFHAKSVMMQNSSTLIKQIMDSAPAKSSIMMQFKNTC